MAASLPLYKAYVVPGPRTAHNKLIMLYLFYGFLLRTLSMYKINIHDEKALCHRREWFAMFRMKLGKAFFHKYFKPLL